MWDTTDGARYYEILLDPVTADSDVMQVQVGLHLGFVKVHEHEPLPKRPRGERKTCHLVVCVYSVLVQLLL